MTVRARCSVFIATSLDGMIARTDGSIDWLEAVQRRLPAGEDCGYGEFFRRIDGLVMGRRTFEQVLTFSEWPYGATPIYVLSRRGITLPAGIPPSVRVTAETPTELLDRLSSLGHRHLYVDGGMTVQSFLAAGLLDELTITLIPTVLGAGRPLFGPMMADLALELQTTRCFPGGLVQNTYRVLPSPAHSTDLAKEQT